MLGEDMWFFNEEKDQEELQIQISIGQLFKRLTTWLKNKDLTRNWIKMESIYSNINKQDRMQGRWHKQKNWIQQNRHNWNKLELLDSRQNYQHQNKDDKTWLCQWWKMPTCKKEEMLEHLFQDCEDTKKLWHLWGEILKNSRREDRKYYRNAIAQCIRE